MSQLIARHCTPDTYPVMHAIHRFVDANVSLFSPTEQADAQGASNNVAHILLVELPGMTPWRNIMTTIVPMLQAFVASIIVSGKVAKTVDDHGATLLAGRAYDFGTSVLFEAFRALHPTADHAAFYTALLKERGVL